MKITEITLGRLRVPLKTPFKTALRSVASVDDVIVMVSTDEGLTGYGSAPATAVITGDTHGSITDAIRHYMAPRVIGEDITDLNRVTALIQGSLAGNTSAKAALEIAIYDLWGQRHRAPVYQLLGGGTPSLTTDLTISVDGIDKMVADSMDAVARGFTSLKVKVGKDIRVDMERVRAIHRAVGDRASLRLDANQGWTPKEAVRALGRIEDAGIPLDLVEQPVKAHDIEGMRYVTERVSTPVMADESVFGPAEAIEIIRLRAADIINIKLMKAGGLSNALRIADIAAVYGVQCMMGCMLESSIGVAAAAHVAIAKSHVITRIDLDAPSLCVSDPVEGGVTFHEANISVSGAPGVGVRRIQGLELT